MSMQSKGLWQGKDCQFPSFQPMPWKTEGADPFGSTLGVGHCMLVLCINVIKLILTRDKYFLSCLLTMEVFFSF